MKTSPALTCIGLGLAVGFAAGWFGARYRPGALTLETTNRTLAAEIGGDVRALQHLRAGNSSNAVKILEAQLDGALVALHASLSISPSAGRDSFPFEMLDLAREYRAKFPHPSDSAEMEKGIADAFRLAEERKKP